MLTIAPAPTFARSYSGRVSGLLPRAYVVSTKLDGLSDRDIDQLWRRLRQGDESVRELLTEHYLPLVRICAERMHSRLPSHVEVEELCGAGVFGLMAAINGFDPDRGVKFEAYAKQRINGSILDDLRNQDFAPRLVRAQSHRLERAYKEAETECGHAPEAETVATKLGISMEEYDRWLREINMANIVSLDRAGSEYDNDGKEVRKVDTIEDQHTAPPMSAMERKELIELATRGLSKKEKLVVVLYYLEELTMKEIGLVLDLSESRVCQIHHRILYRLKQQLSRLRTDLVQ